MVGSDSFESIATDQEAVDADASGWSLIVTHDGAAAVVEVALELDADAELTHGELCEAADVPYKTLYLADTVEALVDVGLLRKNGESSTETTYTVDLDSPVYEAATAFEEAAARRQQFDAA